MDITDLILKDFAVNGCSEIKIKKIIDVIERLTRYTDGKVPVFGPIAAVPNEDGSYTLVDIRKGWGYWPLELKYEGLLTEDAIKDFLKKTANKYRDTAEQLDKIVSDFYKG